MHKYRIDFRWASGVLIHPYDKEGIAIEAHTAEDALTQARIEIDEIGRQNSMVVGGVWSNRYWITKIVPIEEERQEAKR